MDARDNGITLRDVVRILFRHQKKLVFVLSGQVKSGFSRISGVTSRLPNWSKRIGVGPTEEKG